MIRVRDPVKWAWIEWGLYWICEWIEWFCWDWVLIWDFEIDEKKKKSYDLYECIIWCRKCVCVKWCEREIGWRCREMLCLLLCFDLTKNEITYCCIQILCNFQITSTITNERWDVFITRYTRKLYIFKCFINGLYDVVIKAQDKMKRLKYHIGLFILFSLWIEHYVNKLYKW